MAVNKVEVGGETVLDLTEDTVSENNLLVGATAHNAAGEPIEGAVGAATPDSDGLMSAEDKRKLDGISTGGGSSGADIGDFSVSAYGKENILFIDNETYYSVPEITFIGDDKYVLGYGTNGDINVTKRGVLIGYPDKTYNVKNIKVLFSDKKVNIPDLTWTKGTYVTCDSIGALNDITNLRTTKVGYSSYKGSLPYSTFEDYCLYTNSFTVTEDLVDLITNVSYCTTNYPGHFDVYFKDETDNKIYKLNQTDLSANTSTQYFSNKNIHIPTNVIGHTGKIGIYFCRFSVSGSQSGVSYSFYPFNGTNTVSLAFV